MTLADRGTREDRLRESLAAAERRLAEVRSTACEQDYRAMVDRYRARLKEAQR